LWTWSVVNVICCERDLLWTWSVVNVICCERDLLWTWSLMNVVCNERVCNEQVCHECCLLQWCRRRGCRGCKSTPKSFDLWKIRAKCEWIRAQMFRHSVTILLKWLLGLACIKICLLCNIKGSGYRSVTSHAFRINFWVCHFNGIFMVM